MKENITTCASYEIQSTDVPEQLTELSTTSSVIDCIACSMSIGPQTVAAYMKSITTSVRLIK